MQYIQKIQCTEYVEERFPINLSKNVVLCVLMCSLPVLQGYVSSFSEVKLDRNGVVDWRGGRNTGRTVTGLESASVRCLVVHLR